MRQRLRGGSLPLLTRGKRVFGAAAARLERLCRCAQRLQLRLCRPQPRFISPTLSISRLHGTAHGITLLHESLTAALSRLTSGLQLVHLRRGGRRGLGRSGLGRSQRLLQLRHTLRLRL